MLKDIHASSEIYPLRKVIIHRPDVGISRISPKRSEELLFDDIVHLPAMQEEHDIFSAVLKAFVGAENVLETEQLVSEALDASPVGKENLLENIIRYEELPRLYKQKLHELPPQELAKTLISGYLKSEDLIILDPIPNFIFTRDIAVTINDFVLITKAAKEARHRENLLTRFFFYHHPMFKQMHENNRIINLNHIDEFPPSRKGQPVSAEGGDIMIINENFLLVGCSERTSLHGFESLKKALFDRNVIDHVVQVNIPSDRSYMHIDTLFTQINEKHVVAYKPIVCDGIGSNAIVHSKTGAVRPYNSIEEFFQKEIDPSIVFIHAGKGESPYQEREQWTDGCNLVSLKPGVGITYDRNPVTEEAFKKHGYTIIHAPELLSQIENGLDIQTLENTIITLPSSELSRARGGSHCMTCPLLRL